VDGATGEPCERPHDPRAYGTRLWDALVATAQHALDTDLPPQTHGARPRLLVTLDHDTLLAGLGARGAATTVDGLDLPAGVIRRLACDADLIPAVLGGHGEVLDVGRTQRLVTPAIWTALVLRDRHCTFPGCTRPPLMCHAHHLTHWLAGGTTSLHNLALLCGHHHRTIYHTLANTTQPRRQATRVPPTTQTPHRTTMDPISTTKGMSAREESRHNARPLPPRKGGALLHSLPHGRALPRAGQGRSRTTVSATQAGLSSPSISITCRKVSCLPAGRSVTSPMVTRLRMREPTRTGCGKRTLLTP
jgi:hypothetical protein